ncbi:MAG: guanylate kinase, partial [Thermotoga sp.]
RLRKRGTDSEYDLKRRLEDAKWELSKISEFEYLIVNDFLEKSVEKLKAIITAERMRTKRIKLERLPFFQ